MSNNKKLPNIIERGFAAPKPRKVVTNQNPPPPPPP